MNPPGCGYADTAMTRSWAPDPCHALIQEKIKKQLAEELLFGKLLHGGHVIVSAEDDEITIEIEEKETAGMAISAD